MRNCIKKMRLSFIAIAVLTVGWSSYSMANNTHRTGLKETTPQQEEFIKKNWKKVKKVKPNKIGLERINKARKQKNLPLLDETVLTPIGEDVMGALAGEEGDIAQEPLGETLPTFVDNSLLPAFPGIRSQGQQGSCVGWGSTYYQMTHNTALLRGWSHTEGNMSTIFSPKWTYNMINFGEDEGSYFTDAFRLLEKNGAALWSEFPYSDTEYRQWSLDPEVWRNAISHRTEGYQYISSIDDNLEQLKALLNNGYAVTFGTWISSWQYTTILDDPATTDDDALVGQKISHWMQGTVGGHMMTFVGYSDDIWVDINGNGTVDSGEKGALKVANSWGTGWSGGNEGFIWLAYDAIRDFSAVSGAFKDNDNRVAAIMSFRVYHLVVQEHYTPKVLAKVTLNHAKRDQLRVTLGVTDETQTTIWFPFAMNAIGVNNYPTGGPYAFDGSTTAIDGTFFFDFTDIIPDYTGARWYVDVEDTTSGDSATLSLFEMVDVNNGDSTVISTDVPQAVDNGLVKANVHYDYNEGNLLPHAIFEATPISGYMPLDVDFNASASYDDDGSIIHYEWNFGDGSTVATGVHQSHTYVNNGNYTVTLTVTDNEKAHNTSIKTIEVINEAPTAVLVATPTSGDIPFDVTLDASQSIDDDGQIVEYNWDFGDGTTLSKDTNDLFIHTYTTAGDFTITLTVIDNGGETDSATAVIEAIDPSSINAPTRLSSSVDGSTVNLSWSDNNEETFVVQRAKKIRGKYTFADIEPTVINASTFSDTGLELGTYKYRVYAKRGEITSDYSNEILVKVEEISPPPPPLPGELVAPTDLSAKLSRRTETVALSWNDSNSNEEGFIIERGIDNINYAVISSTSSTQYVDDLNGQVGTFYYRVKAYKGEETSDASNVKTIRKR